MQNGEAARLFIYVFFLGFTLAEGRWGQKASSHTLTRVMVRDQGTTSRGTESMIYMADYGDQSNGFDT